MLLVRSCPRELAVLMRMAFWGRQQNDTEVSHVNDDDDPDDEDFGGVDDAVFSSEREREKGGRGPSGTRSRAEAIARRGGGAVSTQE